MISFETKTFSEKSKILLDYSNKKELKNIVETLADILIPTNTLDRESFYKYDKNISDSVYFAHIMNSVKNIIKLYGERNIWFYMVKMLNIGHLAFEVIFDDKQTKIIGFQELEPGTLSPHYDKKEGPSWIQYNNDPSLKRILKSDQVITANFHCITDDCHDATYLQSLINAYENLSNWENILQYSQVKEQPLMNPEEVTHFLKQELIHTSKIPPIYYATFGVSKYNYMQHKCVPDFNKFITNIMIEFLNLINKPLAIDMKLQKIKSPEIIKVSPIHYTY